MANVKRSTTGIPNQRDAGQSANRGAGTCRPERDGRCDFIRAEQRRWQLTRSDFAANFWQRFADANRNLDSSAGADCHGNSATDRDAGAADENAAADPNPADPDRHARAGYSNSRNAIPGGADVYRRKL